MDPAVKEHKRRQLAHLREAYPTPFGEVADIINRLAAEVDPDSVPQSAESVLQVTVDALTASLAEANARAEAAESALAALRATSANAAPATETAPETAVAALAGAPQG